MTQIANMITELPELDEYQEQCLVIVWKFENIERLPDLEWLNASLNGARVTIGTAVKLKKAGMVKGVPDLNMPVPMGGYSGLYIEMKRKHGGVVSDHQKRWLIKLTRNGFFACVCEGAPATIRVLEDYLAGRIKKKIWR